MAPVQEPRRPLVVSSNRFYDIDPYCRHLWGSRDKHLWMGIVPWEFPQNATREQETSFLLEFFGQDEIDVQGGSDGTGEGCRFLKQVWYTCAIWNWEHRIPMIAKQWLALEGNQKMVDDPSMTKWLFSEGAKPSTFFTSNDSAMFGERCLYVALGYLRGLIYQRLSEKGGYTLPPIDATLDKHDRDPKRASPTAEGLCSNNSPNEKNAATLTSERETPQVKISPVLTAQHRSTKGKVTARSHPENASEGDCPQITSKSHVSEASRDSSVAPQQRSNAVIESADTLPSQKLTAVGVHTEKAMLARDGLNVDACEFRVTPGSVNSKKVSNHSNFKRTESSAKELLRRDDAAKGRSSRFESMDRPNNLPHQGLSRHRDAEYDSSSSVPWPRRNVPNFDLPSSHPKFHQKAGSPPKSDSQTQIIGEDYERFPQDARQQAPWALRTGKTGGTSHNNTGRYPAHSNNYTSKRRESESSENIRQMRNVGNAGAGFPSSMRYVTNPYPNGVFEGHSIPGYETVNAQRQSIHLVDYDSAGRVTAPRDVSGLGQRPFDRGRMAANGIVGSTAAAANVIDRFTIGPECTHVTKLILLRVPDSMTDAHVLDWFKRFSRVEAAFGIPSFAVGTRHVFVVFQDHLSARNALSQRGGTWPGGILNIEVPREYYMNSPFQSQPIYANEFRGYHAPRIIEASVANGDHPYLQVEPQGSKLVDKNSGTVFASDQNPSAKEPESSKTVKKTNKKNKKRANTWHSHPDLIDKPSKDVGGEVETRDASDKPPSTAERHELKPSLVKRSVIATQVKSSIDSTAQLAINNVQRFRAGTERRDHDSDKEQPVRDAVHRTSHPQEAISPNGQAKSPRESEQVAQNSKEPQEVQSLQESKPLESLRSPCDDLVQNVGTEGKKTPTVSETVHEHERSVSGDVKLNEVFEETSQDLITSDLGESGKPPEEVVVLHLQDSAADEGSCGYGEKPLESISEMSICASALESKNKAQTDIPVLVLHSTTKPSGTTSNPSAVTKMSSPTPDVAAGRASAKMKGPAQTESLSMFAKKPKAVPQKKSKTKRGKSASSKSQSEDIRGVPGRHVTSHTSSFSSEVVSPDVTNAEGASTTSASIPKQDDDSRDSNLVTRVNSESTTCITIPNLDRPEHTPDHLLTGEEHTGESRANNRNGGKVQRVEEGVHIGRSSLVSQKDSSNGLDEQQQGSSKSVMETLVRPYHRYGFERNGLAAKIESDDDTETASTMSGEGVITPTSNGERIMTSPSHDVENRQELVAKIRARQQSASKPHLVVESPNRRKNVKRRSKSRRNADSEPNTQLFRVKEDDYSDNLHDDLVDQDMINAALALRRLGQEIGEDEMGTTTGS